MGSVTEKQARINLTEELTGFLKAERDSLCAVWVEELFHQSFMVRYFPDESARSNLASRLREVYDGIIAHLERPEIPPGGEALPAIVRLYYDKEISPDHGSRTQIILKRLVMRRLVARYGANREALAGMCTIYEDQIDEARIRARALRHEMEVAKHQEWLAEIHLSSTVNLLNRAVISASSADQIPQLLFTNLRDLFQYDTAIFGVLTRDGKEVECSCVYSGGSHLEIVNAGETERFVIAECIQRNEPIILPDTQADPSSSKYPILTKLGVRSSVVAPLSARGQIIGALLLGSSRPNAYSERDKNLLARIASEISLAIQNLDLLATEKKRSGELEMINAVSKIVTEHLDVKGLLQAAAHALQRTFAYYDVSFFLVERASNEVVMTAQAGAFGELLETGYRQPMGVGMVGWTAQHGQTLVANDVSKEPRRIIAFEGEAECKSEMTVPIKVGENVIGVINVESRQLAAFDERDRIALETIAQEIAKGIENARLYNQTRILKELSEDIVSSIPLTLLVLDRQLRVVGSNPASLSNLGVAESTLKGRRLHELVANDPPSSVFLANVQQAVQRGHLVSFTGLSVTLANLGQRIFNIWFSPTRAHTEGVGLLILQDVTQESLIEEEMRRVRKHLQAVMTHLPIGVASTDMNGVYTYWSTGCERIFGYKAQEVVGKRTAQFLAKVPYDLPTELEQCKREGFQETERINIRKDGADIWVRKVRTNLYDESGQQIGYTSYLLDITQRRMAEEDLIREKQKLSEVVTAIGAGIALMDLNHKITWANKTLHDWFGGSQAVVGKNCFEIFHAQSAKCDNCLSARALATGQVQKHLHTMRVGDGAIKHFQHIVAPIRDRSGNVSQLLCMTMDVTEHVERFNQLELLFDLSEMMQGVLELDRLFYLILTCVTAGEGLGFNRAVLLLADWDRGALEGRMGVGPSSAEEAGRIWHEIRTEKKTLQDFLDQYDNMSPSQQQAMVAMAQPMRFSLTETLEVPVACLLKKEPITVSDAPRDPGVSARFRQLMGTDQFVAVPLVARGEAIGVLLADNRFSRQPITENSVRLLNIIAARAAMSIANAEAYHRLEEKIQQLAETRDRLVRSERLAAIGNMAAHVAHEIRNPLVTIGGFARAILRDADPSSLCGQHSRIIVDEVTRLEKILANVMNFTKPTPPHRAEANVDEIIDATCSLLADQLKSKNVELVKDLHLGNEKTFIDAAQMKQVFLNVIQNAVDSLEHHGRITIRTEAEDARVRIDISDTGTGMSAEVQESIFLPFFTTKPDGTGLGLAVSRKIVEDHGGDIQVQSTLGAGTTFSIFLPRTGSASSS